jgi:hypothetical protein
MASLFLGVCVNVDSFFIDKIKSLKFWISFNSKARSIRVDSKSFLDF